MTISQPNYDKQGDIDAFIKRIKEQNEDTKKFEGMLKKMDSVGDRVDNFLGGDQMIAQKYNNPAGLPPDVYEAIQSQYGNELFGPYTTDKMRTVIDYYKGLGKPL